MLIAILPMMSVLDSASGQDPDLRHYEEAIIAHKDMVVSVINVTGTHTGNFFILPPTGNEISY